MGRKLKALGTDAHPQLLQTVAGKRGRYYSLLQGESVWVKGTSRGHQGHASKGKQVQIGTIKSDNGIGECDLNIRFLSNNPEFIPWRVYRLGISEYQYIKREQADIDELLILVRFFRSQMRKQQREEMLNLPRSKNFLGNKSDRHAVALAMQSYKVEEDLQRKIQAVLDREKKARDKEE